MLVIEIIINKIQVIWSFVPLDTTMQYWLARLKPRGTAETEEQLIIREQIRKQQENLELIHNLTLEKKNCDPEAIITKIIEAWEVKRYGYSVIKPEYLFKGAKLPERENIAFVFAIPMSYDNMKSVPSLISATEILDAYRRVGEIVVEITKELRLSGIQASGHHPLGDLHDFHHLLMPPFAMEAGLGEKGRTGLFIDHELGPLVRLGIVTLEANIETNVPITKGITEFCKRCMYCVSRCPSKALDDTSYQNYLKNNAEFSFKIQGEKCIKYFDRNYACGRCVFHCIIAQPTTAEIKMKIERIQGWYEKWLVSGEYKKMMDQFIITE
ncbi:MAG: hypothetical protein INQ03_06475 [Candidatus Heimdallarchaeota archaeon]|nr:hypothetical protein [Candidatus Heimdallarchaeota archaeon]